MSWKPTDRLTKRAVQRVRDYNESGNLSDGYPAEDFQSPAIAYSDDLMYLSAWANYMNDPTPLTLDVLRGELGDDFLVWNTPEYMKWLWVPVKGVGVEYVASAPDEPGTTRVRGVAVTTLGQLRRVLSVVRGE